VRTTTGQTVTSAEQITENVREMYRRHPFPTKQRRHTYKRHAAFVRRFLESQGIDPAGKRFGDIACGTGLMLLDYALEFPETEFSGYDLSEVSVERANAVLKEEGATNAGAQIANIMELELENEFDYLLSWGTIHHLSDPREGVRRLCRSLKPGGVIRTGIYGFFGNWERRVQQDIVSTLTSDRDMLDFDSKIEAVRDYAIADRNFKNYYTAPPVDTEDDDWVVDEFLHVWEKHLLLKDVVSWLEAEDMQVLAMTDYYDREISLDIADHTTRASFVERVNRLPFAEQCHVVEAIVRPYWLSLLARKQS
jgi:SAM-dependent methyltransferase